MYKGGKTNGEASDFMNTIKKMTCSNGWYLFCKHY